MSHQDRSTTGSQLNVKEEMARHAALLAVFSGFVLVEGIGRFIQSAPDTPTSDLGGDSTTFPPIVAILGSTFEVIFGFTGLFVGVAGFVLDYYHPTLTKATVTCQLIFGWFTFAVYTLAIPLFNHAKAIGPPVYAPDSFDVSQQRAALWFGHVLPSLGICGIMQGFQFFAALELLRFQNGQTQVELWKRKSRLFYYSLLVFLIGFGTFVLGVMISREVGSGRLPNAAAQSLFIYPPTIVTYANLVILSGVVVTVFSLLGFLACLSPCLNHWVIKFAPIVWLWMCTGHIMTQLGLAGPQFAFAGEMIIGLTSSMVIAVVYLAHKLNPDAVAASSTAKPTLPL